MENDIRQALIGSSVSFGRDEKDEEMEDSAQDKESLSHSGASPGTCNVQLKSGKPGKAATIGLVMAALLVIRSDFLSPSRAAPNQLDEELKHGFCFPTFDDMPETWRPPENSYPESDEPWSEAEQRAADSAVLSGYWEMHTIVSGLTDKEIIDLKYNAVEAFLDGAYAAGGVMPELEFRSLREAARLFETISRGYMGKDGRSTICKNVRKYMNCAVFGHVISSRLPDHPRLQRIQEELVSRANRAIEDCGSLDEIFGYNIAEEMSKPNQTMHNVYSWVLRSNLLVDTLAIPQLNLPKDTDRIVWQTWVYLENYPFEDAPFDSDFAYTVTHAPYIATGYGRHIFKVSDAPWIFNYIREHFYHAMQDTMQSGDLDLFSEFVDFLRSVGCTEATDAQLRHGARYLLHIYQEQNGYQWSPREEYDNIMVKQRHINYYKLHAPWTGMSGLRRRAFEPVIPGTYGAAFREAIDKWSMMKKKVGGPSNAQAVHGKKAAMP